MVSKIAVIALVAVIAVPIMMGYALNLEEETGYRYENTGQPLNVTPYLENSAEYNYTNVDAYTLNSQHNFGHNNYAGSYPAYETFSTNRSSVQLNVAKYTNGAMPQPIYTSGLSMLEIIFEYTSTDNINTSYPIVTIYTNSGGSVVYYDAFTRVINITMSPQYGVATNLIQYNAGLNMQQTNTIISSVARIDISNAGNWKGNITVYTQTQNNPTGQYANLADGFRLNTADPALNSGVAFTQIKNTMDVKSELFTFDLDSITSESAIFSIDGSSLPPILNSTNRSWLEFEKTTTNGVVSWVATSYQRVSNGPIIIRDTMELYYNPAGNNTYQVLMDHYGGQLRYVGAWPATMGPANVYKTYDYTLRDGSFDENPVFKEYIYIYGYTPIMRIDGATARAFVSSVIEDSTYEPGAFRDNPSTTITDLKVVGTSITFGGQTFAATKDGYITLSGHRVPINKLTFNSVPAAGGGYDNRIGEDVISNTPEPSTITFNGRWGANVSTISQSEVSYSETKWIAGGFAFDGVDGDFLMIGLIACVGSFIALGVYGRRSGAKVLPLMLVCVGAGIMFLVMI